MGWGKDSAVSNEQGGVGGEIQCSLKCDGGIVSHIEKVRKFSAYLEVPFYLHVPAAHSHI